MANQNPSESSTSDQHLDPQSGITDGCPHKLIIAVGLEEKSEVGKDSVSSDKNKEAEEKVVKQVPSLNCATVEKVEPGALQDVKNDQKNKEVPTLKKAVKMGALTVTTSQKEKDITANTPNQINKKVVGQMCSPTAAEKKVRFTTVVTLQKRKHSSN